MATNYNITMKRYNGTDYDVLYPRTLPSQIDGGVYTKDEATGLFLSKTGGQMSGLLDMNGNKISNLAAPTAANDAATKDYVDNNSYIQTKTLVKSLSQSEITSLATKDMIIQLFTTDQYINGEYKFIETKVSNLKINASGLTTSRFAYVYLGALCFWMSNSAQVNISGEQSFFCYPVVHWIQNNFIISVTFPAEGGVTYYDASSAKTRNYNLNSVSADSIEIYLCK